MSDIQHAGFTVKIATLENANDIAAITHDAFVKYAELAGLETVDALKETNEQILNDINTKIVLVAFIDEKVVGSVRVEVKGENGYLSRFGVDTKYQNSGIGKSLMNMVDFHMRGLGVKRLELHTASKVASLIRFYYSRGFYIDSTSKDKGYIRALMIKEY